MEKERLEEEAVHQARIDLAAQLAKEEEEDARRKRNTDVAQKELQQKAASHNEKLAAERQKKKRKEARQQKARLEKLKTLQVRVWTILEQYGPNHLGL